MAAHPRPAPDPSPAPHPRSALASWQPWLRGLNRRSATTAILAGTGLAMGFIQLLATPLQEVSAVEVQTLAVRTTLFMAPLVVSLLQLLQQGPELLAEATLARRLPRGRWRLRLARAGGMALCSAVLIIYFQAGSMVAAVLTKPEADAVTQLRFLAGNINPLLLLILLLKGALFGALAALITQQRGTRGGMGRGGLATPMADAVLDTTLLLLLLDLVLVVMFDPLRLSTYG